MKMPNARPLRRSLMRACLIASVLVLVTSCGDRPQSAGIKAPPAADLVREDEPQLDVAAVQQDSAAALDAYDTAHAAWGRRLYDQVGRICWWVKDAGAPTPDCGPRTNTP